MRGMSASVRSSTHFNLRGFLWSVRSFVRYVSVKLHLDGILCCPLVRRALENAKTKCSCVASRRAAFYNARSAGRPIMCFPEMRCFPPRLQPPFEHELPWGTLDTPRRLLWVLTRAFHPRCSGLLNELEIPTGADLVRASLAGEVRGGECASVPCSTLEYPLEYS